MMHRLTILSIVALAACSGGTEPGSARVATIVAEPDDSLSAFVGSRLGDLRLRALDANGRGVAGASIALSSSGRAGLAASSLVTGSDGRAVVPAWTLPTTPGRDTIVATAPGGATSRILLDLRAGPAAEIVVDQQPAAQGMVGEPFAPATIFRIVDPYGNPMARTGLRVVLEPAANDPAGARSRLPTELVSDAQGRAFVEEWVPRTLGSHAFHVEVADGSGVRSPTVSREVRAPACAPEAMLAVSTTATALTVQGTLGVATLATCADTVDRLAFAVDAPRVYTFRVAGGASARVVRAGPLLAERVILPPRPPVQGDWRVALGPGEYELVLGLPSGEAGASWAAATFARAPELFTLAGCDTTWMTLGAVAYGSANCRRPAPELELPDAQPLQAIYAMEAGAIAGRRVTVDVAAALGGPSPFDPVVAFYARERATGTRRLLGVTRGTSGLASRTLDLSADVDQLVALVGVPSVSGGGAAYSVSVR